MESIQRTDLPNGIRVISDTQPQALSTSVGAWLTVGSADETPPQAGIAHFLEHLIFKGTATRTARGIAERFDALGADLNAFTTKETTCVHARVLPEDLLEAVEVIGDLVERPSMTDADIEAERGVILEEMAMHEDTPDDLVYDLFAEAIWPDSGIGRRIQGLSETIRAATGDMIRGFHGDFYPNVPLVVSASGALDHNALVEAVSKHFSEAPRPTDIRTGFAPVARAGARAAFDRDGEQSHLVLGVRGLARNDERRWALAILNAAMGGGMSSRLFQEIREERGLAYQVGSGNQGFADCGLFTIYAGCAPEQLSTVSGLIQRIVGEVAADGISVEEFERAKGHLTGGVLMGFEEPGAMMHHLGKSVLLTPGVLTPDDIRAKIEAVSLEECSSVAREVFCAETWSVAVVGPDPDPTIEGFRLTEEAA